MCPSAFRIHINFQDQAMPFPAAHPCYKLQILPWVVQVLVRPLAWLAVLLPSSVFPLYFLFINVGFKIWFENFLCPSLLLPPLDPNSWSLNTDTLTHRAHGQPSLKNQSMDWAYWITPKRRWHSWNPFKQALNCWSGTITGEEQIALVFLALLDQSCEDCWQVKVAQKMWLRVFLTKQRIPYMLGKLLGQEGWEEMVWKW